jgi:hypothetical protein
MEKIITIGLLIVAATTLVLTFVDKLLFLV